MNTSCSFLRVGLAALIASSAGLLIPAPAATAQVIRMASSGGAISGGGFSRTIAAPTLEKYCGVLGYDESQRTAAKAFHEDYLRGVAEADKALADANKKMKELMEDGDHQEAMKKMGENQGKYAKAKSDAATQLLANLKDLMKADQAPRWEKLERMRRRESISGGFMVAGASVDLIDVMGALKLPEAEAAKIAGPLDEYERDFDHAIADYNRFQARREEEQRKKEKGKEGGEEASFNLDMEEIQKMMEEDRKEAGKLRDVNKAFVGRLGAALSDEWKKKLDKEWLARAYRRIFAEPHTLKQLKTAVGFGDLTADQKTKVSEMLETYQKELEVANAKWLDEQQRAEADGKDGGGMPFMGEDNTPEGLKKARSARQELDKKFSKSLREILSEEQKDRLPKRKNGGFVLPDGGEVFTDFDIEGGAAEIHVFQAGGPG